MQVKTATAVDSVEVEAAFEEEEETEAEEEEEVALALEIEEDSAVVIEVVVEGSADEVDSVTAADEEATEGEGEERPVDVVVVSVPPTLLLTGRGG